MEILSTIRPSFRIENFSQKNAANDFFLQDTVAVETNISPRDHAIHRILLAPFSFIMADGEKLEGYIKKSNTDKFLDDIKPIQARRALLVHDVKKRMSVLNNVFLQHPELKSQVLSPDVQERVSSVLAAPKNTCATLISNFSNSDAFSTLSSKEINELLSGTIGEMSEDYLDVFQQAVEKNAQFYKDFSDFMTTLPEFISADGDKTILDGKAFKQSLQALMDKYPVPGMSTTLFPVQTGATLQGASLEECEAWAREFGLSTDDCIYQLPDGSYIVHIDVSPLININDSVENKDMSFNAAQWSAWQTGVDMQKDHIQNSMQTLTQKFANAHSTFDNLVKVLSSTIASLLECDKQFFV